MNVKTMEEVWTFLDENSGLSSRVWGGFNRLDRMNIEADVAQRGWRFVLQRAAREVGVNVTCESDPWGSCTLYVERKRDADAIVRATGGTVSGNVDAWAYAFRHGLGGSVLLRWRVGND